MSSHLLRNLVIVVIMTIALTLLYITFSTPKGDEKQLADIATTTPMNSKLHIDVLAEGTGQGIANGQNAAVYYVGKLDDGSVFDQNTTGEGFVFPLGAGRVIEGWDLGVLGMKVGEKRRLVIPPELAYGSRGAGNVIPPNATLTFEVELRAIK